MVKALNNLIGTLVLWSLMHASATGQECSVAIKVIDESGRGVAFAALSLNGETKVTDSQGFAEFQYKEEEEEEKLKISCQHMLFVELSKSFISSDLCNSDLSIKLESKIIDVNEAVVTGEGAPTMQDSALRKIRVLGKDMIEGRAAVSARDLLRNELNFRTSEDMILGSGISMQGLGGENVKVLIDGVPVVGRLNGNIDLSQINLDQIDRVEIVEGPMSVEYGTDALAGTINFITKKRTDYSIAYRYESVGSYAVDAKASYKKKNTVYEVSGKRQYFDGWNATDVGFDWIQDFVADSGRVQFWNPKIQNSINIGASHLMGNWTIAPTLRYFNETIENRGYPRAPYGELAFDDYYITNRFSPSVILKKFNEDKQVVKITVAYNRFEREKNRYSLDLTTMQADLLSENDASDTTIVDHFMSRGSINFNILPRISATAGYDVNGEVLTGGRISNEAKGLVDGAGFGLVRYKKNRFNAQIGARETWNSAYDSKLTPSGHLMWTNDKGQLRASWAQGYRAPSIKELYFEFVDINHQLFGNENLQPETSSNTQISWTQKAFGGAFEASLFSNDVDQLIELVSDTTGLQYFYENVGDFNSHGAKTKFSTNINKLTCEFGASILGVQVDGFEEFMYSSEYATDLRYGFNKSRTTAQLSMKYNGRVSRYFYDADGEIILGTNDAYTMADFTVQHTAMDGCLRTSFAVRNIFDIRNVGSTMMTSSGHSSGGGSFPMSWGRSIVISAKWNFKPVSK